MTKIVYFDVQENETDFLKEHNEGKYDYALTQGSLNDLNPLKDSYKKAEIISVFTTSRVDERVLGQFENLKLIALRSVGFNHIDLEYCNRNNIFVVNTPNYGNKSVAEFAFGLMLDVCRKITKSYMDFKDMDVVPQKLIGSELGGKTVGVIGLGAIGSEFARLAYGFDMEILGYDKYPRYELSDKYNVRFVDFDTLLEQSDFISIHTPLTPENRHMFNDESFKKMKNSSILINTARGEHIDTMALYNAISKKQIAGAGLDVVESEETLSDPEYLIDINKLNECALKQTILNTRLQQLPNVIITPHIAYNTKEAIYRILSTTMSNISAFLEGNLQNCVNK